MKRALIAFFVGLALVGAAAAQQSQTAQTKAPEITASSARVVQVPERPATQSFRISPEVTEKFRQDGVPTFEVPFPTTNFCYTMQSFVFAREDGGDAMRLVSHRTCTPGSRFRMKKAVVTPR